MISLTSINTVSSSSKLTKKNKWLEIKGGGRAGGGGEGGGGAPHASFWIRLWYIYIIDKDIVETFYK